MANKEQLSILKQGVEIWNQWRRNNLDKDVDLCGVDQRDTNLTEVDFRGANISNVDFSGSDLSRAFLRGANLRGSKLVGTTLTNAILSNAIVDEANFWSANLRGTDFRDAKIRGGDFAGAILEETDFTKAIFGETIFGDNDLSKVIGLNTVVHHGPSILGNRAFQKSKGMIPEIFLRGCGFSDWEIEAVKLYNPNLSNQEISELQYKIFDLRAQQPLQISPLFISYSHTDSFFVDKLEAYLNKKGIRFWRDVHHAIAGRLEKQIDRAIRHNPTVLVVLSRNSTQSDWVEHEVRTARKLEKELGRDTLCPIALDDSWEKSPWPVRVMEQVLEYNILDFSNWQDDSTFSEMFKKLIDRLELFYK